MTMKIKGRSGKWALRENLYKRVPRELIERPEVGFGIPIGQWLSGPLHPWPKIYSIRWLCNARATCTQNPFSAYGANTSAADSITPFAYGLC